MNKKKLNEQVLITKDESSVRELKDSVSLVQREFLTFANSIGMKDNSCVSLYRTNFLKSKYLVFLYGTKDGLLHGLTSTMQRVQELENGCGLGSFSNTNTVRKKG